MSKVVHLSDDAHKQAKEFCRKHGLKMSDWVAELIAAAIVNEWADLKTVRLRPLPPAPPTPAPVVTHTPVVVATPVVTATPVAAAPISHGPPKKRLEQKPEPPPQANGEGVPPWAQPPFWSGRAQSK